LFTERTYNKKSRPASAVAPRPKPVMLTIIRKDDSNARERAP
jgi:hypothetical protein